MPKKKTSGKADVLKMVPRESEDTYTMERALTELLADVKAGKIKPVKAIVYYLEDGAGPGKWLPTIWHCGTDRFEAIALLELCRSRLVALTRGMEDQDDEGDER